MNGKYKYVTIASLLSAAVLLGTGCTMTEQKQNDTAKTQNTANASKDAKDQKDDSSLEDQEFILESKYFNQIKDVDGLPTIQNPENILALVNKEYALPGNYAPSDLTVPDVAFFLPRISTSGISEKKPPKRLKRCSVPRKRRL